MSKGNSYIFGQTLISEKCSAETEGLKLCTSISKISLNSDEKVYLDLSWTNSSNIERKIMRDTSYSVTIISEKGEKLIPVSRQKNLKDITSEDWEKTGKVSFGSYKTIFLEPNQTQTVRISLTEKYDYDLTVKGEYKISISKSVPSLEKEKTLEFVIDDIELEIK